MDLKQEENVGTMDVLERHAFNLNSLETYMKNNVENITYKDLDKICKT